MYGTELCRLFEVPGSIPRLQRNPMDTGHGSFMVMRSGNSRHLFNRQAVRVKNHALIWVDRGFLRVVHKGCQRLVSAGQVVILTATEADICELVAPQETFGRFFWFHFNDAALDKAIPHVPEIYEYIGNLSKASTIDETCLVLPYLAGHWCLSDGMRGVLRIILGRAFEDCHSGFMKLCLPALQRKIPDLSLRAKDGAKT